MSEIKGKVLFVATVDLKHIIKFHIPFLKLFHEKGYEVHVACAGDATIPYCDVKHSIPFERAPFKWDNIKSYNKLKKIIDGNEFKLIHCHTPVGGVVGRLAARDARKRGTRVLYTAHGFHFYKGAPIKYWVLFYPVEKWFARYTDHLITINDEDYQLAVRKKFKAKQISHVKGVGIDLERFERVTDEKRTLLRKQYGYSEDEYILIYVAEMTYRKHQDLLITAMKDLKNLIPKVHLLLVGDGEKLLEYEHLARELDVVDIVEFAGYRNDIPELMSLSNVAVSSSRQEGLPVNIMEAMAIGLPVIASSCRGNIDLIRNGYSGFIFDNQNPLDLVEKIMKIKKDVKHTNQDFGYAAEILNKYSLKTILYVMESIYCHELDI